MLSLESVAALPVPVLEPEGWVVKAVFSLEPVGTTTAPPLASLLLDPEDEASEEAAECALEFVGATVVTVLPSASVVVSTAPVWLAPDSD